MNLTVYVQYSKLKAFSVSLSMVLKSLNTVSVHGPETFKVKLHTIKSEPSLLPKYVHTYKVF